jgi:hypothetical protein
VLMINYQDRNWRSRYVSLGLSMRWTWLRGWWRHQSFFWLSIVVWSVTIVTMLLLEGMKDDHLGKHTLKGWHGTYKV